MLTAALLAFALVAIVAASGLVYRDARRVGVAWPPLWALVVFWTETLALGLFLFVPTVPVPGLLVIVLVGPVLYLFERDDTRHGDEPADPHVLLDSGADRSPGADGDDPDERDAEN